ncbi:MAG: DUF790 family protein [Blastochloris sp.]|nr:DUF790 family protein [Blastochloris sp.]
MLTSDLIKPRLRTRQGALHVQMLPYDAPNRQTAADLIDLFMGQVGRTRADWEVALEAHMGDRIDYIVLRGLAKVLEDNATFAPDDMPLPPADLRAALFARGPVFETTDLFRRATRSDAIEAVASQFSLPAAQIESSVFADYPAAYRLTDADEAWSPETLIMRYNLELSRGALYWSDRMVVELFDNYKDFWRYLKLFKLMFWAQPIDGGYRVELDGPISPFVRATTRYGRQFGAFLPALFLGQRWTMQASVRLPGAHHSLTYRLDQKSPLVSHFKRSGAFDSRMEADFAAAFEAKFGGERGAWQLTREDEVLLLGDTVMIPDFAVTHRKDGRRALIEIVGFWHPEYLNRKLAKVREAERSDLILLVYEGVNLTADRLLHIPGEVLYFANKPVLKDVMKSVERCAKL